MCPSLPPSLPPSLEDVSARNINREAVFTNSELSLKHVEVYGFDFDYTLVHYTGELNCTIFERARNRLVEKLNVCALTSL